jgi:hypothetical protein
MAIYRIVRLYEVPAKNRIEATNRMMEALALHVEGDYHLTDYVRSPDDPHGKGKRISLKPPKGWVTTLLDQLLGRSSTNKS